VRRDAKISLGIVSQISRQQVCCTGWRRPIGCLQLQVSFRKRAIDYRALWQRITYKDKACYGSSPPCTIHNGYLSCCSGTQRTSLFVHTGYTAHLYSHVCIYLYKKKKLVSQGIPATSSLHYKQRLFALLQSWLPLTGICVYIYVYIYIYILAMYINIFLYICMYICMYISVYVYIHL